MTLPPNSPNPPGHADDPADLVFNHEKFAGEVIPDPWDDDEQPDWPNAEAVDIRAPRLRIDS